MPGFTFGLGKSSSKQALDGSREATKVEWVRRQRLLFKLPPSRPGAENDVLLPAIRYYGNLGSLAGQRAKHPSLVRLRHRQPGTIDYEMAVVARTLRDRFPELPAEQFVLIGEAELARLADDCPRQELVVVGECWPHPSREVAADCLGAARSAYANSVRLHTWRTGRFPDEARCHLAISLPHPAAVEALIAAPASSAPRSPTLPR